MYAWIGWIVFVWISYRFVRKLWRYKHDSQISSSSSTFSLNEEIGKSALVIVLGDIGRSPRMQYHCLSLADHGWRVHFMGCTETKPMVRLVAHPRILLYSLSTFRKWHGDAWQKCPGMFLFYAIEKIIMQTYSLTVKWVTKVKHVDYIFLQNPPSIPTLMIVQILGWWYQCKLVIDWHNLGYTVIRMRYKSDRHPLVKISLWYEWFFGRNAYMHICVTKAMREFLQKTWHIKGKVITLYDRPGEHFQSLDPMGTIEFLREAIKDESLAFLEPVLRMMENKDISDPKYALCVSSTSWTEDEDFSILVQALDECEKSIQLSKHNFPIIILVITGKGPMKIYYENIFKSKKWEHFIVKTAWFKAEDYSKFLGCADLGLSFHSSSSGLDLPMKILDMYGCNLPVCALNFACLNELVIHERTGLIFSNPQELACQIQTLFENFPETMLLDQMQLNIEAIYHDHWKSNWDRTLLPLLKH